MVNLKLNNIKGGPKSTGLGAILIAFSLYMIYDQASEITDYLLNSGVLATGVSLFFISDKKEEV